MEYSEEFVVDFARRTKKNLKFIEKEVKNQIARGASEEELTVFEVTQMINSFVGLIMFPKERFWKSLPPDAEMRREESRKVFKKIRNNSEYYKYDSTYKKYDEEIKRYVKHEDEELTAKTLILHFRNAVGHKGLDIVSTDSRKNGKIEVIKIKDQNLHENPPMTFSIEIPIGELKDLIIGMCDLLLPPN